LTTIAEIKKALGGVLVPGPLRDIVSLNLLKDFTFSGEDVTVNIIRAALPDNATRWLESKVPAALKEAGVKGKVTLAFEDGKPAALNKVKHTLAVMSGKGGVGKSLVSGLLALALVREGFQVGILDADITGPSIPKMFGLDGMAYGSESGLLPAGTRSGIQVMSINLLMEKTDEAVVWRGPLIARAITQFWEEVLWGELDYLIVDLPPGTADAPLTVLQSLPIEGVVMVFTPQDLTALIVKKAINMVRRMDKKIVGLVENMSYLYIPELDRRLEVFGPSHARELAEFAGSPLLAQIPLDPELVKLCDRGEIEEYTGPVVAELGRALLK
jgi:hydrogenase maturation protease